MQISLLDEPNLNRLAMPLKTLVAARIRLVNRQFDLLARAVEDSKHPEIAVTPNEDGRDLTFAIDKDRVMLRLRMTYSAGPRFRPVSETNSESVEHLIGIPIRMIEIDQRVVILTDRGHERQALTLDFILGRLYRVALPVVADLIELSTLVELGDDGAFADNVAAAKAFAGSNRL